MTLPDSAFRLGLFCSFDCLHGAGILVRNWKTMAIRFLVLVDYRKNMESTSLLISEKRNWGKSREGACSD